MSFSKYVGFDLCFKFFLERFEMAFSRFLPSLDVSSEYYLKKLKSESPVGSAATLVS